MLNFSRRVSELFEQLDAVSTESEPLQDKLLWLTTEARSGLEMDLIEALNRRLSTLDVQAHHANPRSRKQRQDLVERLLAGQSLRIALINDNGFYAEAGIAVARQARSFALAGHKVSVLALNGYSESVLARHRYGRWLSGEGSNHPIHYAVVPNGELPTDRSGALDPTQWILDQQERTGSWDLVILGNLHSCDISLRFIKPLLDNKTPLVWFAHDLDCRGGCAIPSTTAAQGSSAAATTTLVLNPATSTQQPPTVESDNTICNAISSSNTLEFTWLPTAGGVHDNCGNGSAASR